MAFLFISHSFTNKPYSELKKINSIRFIILFLSMLYIYLETNGYFILIKYLIIRTIFSAIFVFLS